MKPGTKVKIVKSISTVEGTLYEGETVRIDRKENGHIRVKDSMGRIWFVNREDIKLIN